MLDEGFTVSVINEKIVDYVGLKCINVDIALKGIGKKATFSSKKVNIIIECDSNTFELNNVLVVKNMAFPMQSVSVELTEICVQKTNILVKPYHCAPDLLLGQDQINLIISRESREIQKNSLFVSRSLLGWSIHGHFSNNAVMQVNTLSDLKPREQLYVSFYDDEINNLVKSYFDIDSLGISNLVRIKPEDKRAVEIFDKTSKYKNRTWEIGLP